MIRDPATLIKMAGMPWMFSAAGLHFGYGGGRGLASQGPGGGDSWGVCCDLQALIERNILYVLNSLYLGLPTTACRRVARFEVYSSNLRPALI